MRTMPQRTMKTTMPEKQLPVKPFSKTPMAEETMGSQEKLNKALITAATRGIFNEVKGLVEKGADPNWQNAVGSKAIDYAKAYDYYRIVEYLEKEMAK